MIGNSPGRKCWAIRPRSVPRVQEARQAFSHQTPTVTSRLGRTFLLAATDLRSWLSPDVALRLRIDTSRRVFAATRLPMGLVLLLGCLLATGCASITSKLNRTPNKLSSSSPSEILSDQKQPLCNPENQSLQITLETARLAEERSMDAEAISAYEKVRRLNPKQPGVAHALAVLYDRSAMTDAAEREYQAAVIESPDDANVLCDYGYFLYCTGKTKQAEEMLRRSMNVDANHRQTKVNLAVVLATQQRYDEAKALFENAIGPAAALHNIGMFKLRHGNAVEGENMIAAAVEKDPSLSQSKAVLESVGSSAGGTYLATGQESIQR
ncbi:MAG: hypothetical protein GY904_19300 [Planctomycetaceae bacterium]|nr:hypothetical protein [Planctomycetaceae bacterium]